MSETREWDRECKICCAPPYEECEAFDHGDFEPWHKNDGPNAPCRWERRENLWTCPVCRTNHMPDVLSRFAPDLPGTCVGFEPPYEPPEEHEFASVWSRDMRICLKCGLRVSEGYLFEASGRLGCKIGDKIPFRDIVGPCAEKDYSWVRAVKLKARMTFPVVWTEWRVKP
jgi:hypothetical protein